MTTEILIKTGIAFDDYRQALDHIADVLTEKGLVKESYRTALFARETDYPTGIELEQNAVAIPHCGAEHAIKPAIYFIRPDKAVAFNRADDEGTVDAEMLIALVVTDPQQQLKLLKTLFGKLQDNAFVSQLLLAREEQLPELINRHFEL